MKRIGACGLVGAIAAALQSAWGAPALAQGAMPGATAVLAPESTGGVGAIAAVALIALLVIGLAVMVKVIDARRRREDRMAAVQGRLSDTLAADPMFARLPLTVTVHGPGWTSGPATVVIGGQVPSEEMRAGARRLVEAEALARIEDFRVVDRIVVDPLAFDRQGLRRAA